MRLEKPTLLLNTQTAKKNIAAMQDKARKSRVSLRPHFKTHQSREIAGWFRQAGISQATVSSLDMAEYFAGDSWNDLLVAIPHNIHETPRVNRLLQKIHLELLTDSVPVTEHLGKHLKKKCGIWIKIDCGYGRTGVNLKDLQQIHEIISAAERQPALEIKGFLTHAGHSYHAGSAEEIRSIYRKTLKAMQSLRTIFSAKAGRPLKVSIGDTPSCCHSDDFCGADEVRCGNFVFFDLMQWQLGSCTMNDIALQLACPVIGVYPGRNEIAVHCGAVHLSKEWLADKKHGKYFGLATEMNTAPGADTEMAKVVSLSQEHGIVKLPPRRIESIKHGDWFVILPVHSCLTVNLMKEYRTLEGRTIKTMGSTKF